MEINKVIVITGGSRGIGRATAERLAGPDTALIITHADPDSSYADQALAAIRAKGAVAEAQDWSTSDSRAAKENFSAVAEKYGRLDVLVNNAGLTRDALAVRMTDEQFQTVLSVNLFGVFACSRAAAKIMMKKKSGRIINIASVVGFTGNIGQANYSASKGGVVALTKTLALELASRNVTVNAVAPGFIETDMTSVLDASVKEALLSRVPLGRLGLPSEVAEVIAFLASPEAAYITGQTLHINGGLYL